MQCFRFSDLISFPSVKMSENFLPGVLPNKCYFALMKTTAVDHGRNLKFLKTISNKESKPVAVILMSNNFDYAKKLPNLSIPTFLIVAGNSLIHIRCASSEKYFSMASIQMLKTKISDVCTIKGQTLHVAYNNVSPYFHVSESGDPMPRQLEFVYLDTFLRHQGLIASYHFANMTWGSQDPVTGRWNGVVGMVNYICSVS